MEPTNETKPDLRIFWWDEQGYGSWAFVLAHSEEEAWDLLKASAKRLDDVDWEQYKPISNGPRYDYRAANVERFRYLKSLRVIEPGQVEWGEFA